MSFFRDRSRYGQAARYMFETLSHVTRRYSPITISATFSEIFSTKTRSRNITREREYETAEKSPPLTIFFSETRENKRGMEVVKKAC
jgi:hypothetical protein